MNVRYRIFGLAQNGDLIDVMEIHESEESAIEWIEENQKRLEEEGRNIERKFEYVILKVYK